MSAKIFLDPSIKWIPQMDYTVKYSENGGIEASQGFLVRKADIGTGQTLAAFTRGTTWATLYPSVPILYQHLSLKTFDPQDYAPGVSLIKATFTGYQYTGGGSSGNPQVIPTTSLRGNLEESTIMESRPWKAMSDASKERLGWLMNTANGFVFSITAGKYGKMDLQLPDGHDDGFRAMDVTGSSQWVIPTGDELIFATMIAQGKTSFKNPSWTYHYKTEAKIGFTAEQLNALGKIVANPPGNPPKPTNDFTWLLVGPEQDQSGPERFSNQLSFQLIPNSQDNKMLYKQ